jgi:hypothetical protein
MDYSVPPCNPSYLGGTEQDCGSRPALAKRSQPIKSWAWWHAPVYPSYKGSINRRVVVQASQGISNTLSQK